MKGRVLPSSVEYKGMTLRIGNFVFIKVPEGQEGSFILEVMFFQRDIETAEITIRGRWFYFPRDTVFQDDAVDTSCPSRKFEVYSSMELDTVPLESVQDQCMVVTFQEFNDLAKARGRNRLRNVFFCRRGYDAKLQTFVELKNQANPRPRDRWDVKKLSARSRLAPYGQAAEEADRRPRKKARVASTALNSKQTRPRQRRVRGTGKGGVFDFDDSARPASRPGAASGSRPVRRGTSTSDQSDSDALSEMSSSVSSCSSQAGSDYQNDASESGSESGSSLFSSSSESSSASDYTPRGRNSRRQRGAPRKRAAKGAKGKDERKPRDKGKAKPAPAGGGLFHTLDSDGGSSNDAMDWAAILHSSSDSESSDSAMSANEWMLSSSDSSGDEGAGPNRKMELPNVARHRIPHSHVQTSSAASPNIDLRDPEQVYAQARTQLQTSTVPRKLPGREKEHHDILRFLALAIQSGGAGSGLYVSGMPGTGKTATMHGVVRRLFKLQRRGLIQPFQYVHINGMRLTDPRHTYTRIYHAVTGKKVTPSHALALLSERFKSPQPRQRVCVVVVDELDYVVTRDQKVLYNLFDWPGHKYARLVVVGIANTMDLPERLLPRIGSRLGMQRVPFPPYTRHQLENIVKGRLAGLPAFSRDAIELCTRRISAVSGDARRALEICARACELAELAWKEQVQTTLAQSGAPVKRPGGAWSSRTRTKPASPLVQVSMDHIDSTIKEMHSSLHIEAISGCSLHERLFLVAVARCIQKRGLAETTFSEAFKHHAGLCRMISIEAPTQTALFRVCSNLGASRLLLVEGAKMGIYRRIRLCFAVDDIRFALQNDTLVNSLLV